MNRRQPIPKHLLSFTVLAALGATLSAGCQQGADAPKQGAQPAPPVAASPAGASPTGAPTADTAPPLIQATRRGDAARVKALLADGAKVNETDSHGKTALIYAAGDNDRAGGGGMGGGGKTDWASRDGIVALLLSHHADPNIVGQDGTTALLAALVHHQSVSGPSDVAGAKAARAQKVRQLLAAGASIKTVTPAETEDHLHRGSTPLMAAAINGDAELVKLLIARGADVNASDQDGNTALILAARLGNADALQQIIASHGDVNARNAKGATALSEATRMKTSQLGKCADLLRGAGAKG